MTERDEAAKKAILARRAKFVAAAVASIGIACGKESAPQPCLSIEPVAPADAGAEAASVPAPCLTVAPQSPPVPTACLSVAQPKDAGGKK